MTRLGAVTERIINHQRTAIQNALRATWDAHAEERPEARVTRLRTLRDELTGDIATLETDEHRLGAELKEARVSRELQPSAAYDAAVAALEGALADLGTRSVPLHDALTRVNAELTDAQRAVGRRAAHAAEAKLRGIVQEMLPLLQKLETLNARLKAERTLAGRGPLPFPLLSEWVRRAEAFVGTGRTANRRG